MKPMLAATLDDISKLSYPVYASPKLDGVRALRKGTLLSRSLKPFPNPHVNKLFDHRELEGLDGELIIGSATAKDVFRQTSGALQRDGGAPDVAFHVFDSFASTASAYEHRLKAVRKVKFPGVVIVEQVLIKESVALLQYESDCLAAGYEGVILRSPIGQYKFGRATEKQQWMLKLKRFVDSEAEVIGVEEEMHNANEAKRNELGRTERSSAKAGLIGTGRMGALLVRDLKSQVEFSIGTGFDAGDREEEWKLGDIVKYKSFLVGVKDKPRFPVFLGRRAKFDR